MSGELLLELLSEEIPARMQRRAIEDLTGLIRDKLAAAEIPATVVTGYVTPRRLTVIADGIPATQPDRSEERRGPRIGAPEAAIGGFLRGAGLSSLDQCEVRTTDRGEFYFAVIRQTGRNTAEILPALLLAAITELPWPKSMRFPAAELRWVRPLNSAICLFDGAVLPLALGEVPVGQVTRGHRFLSPGEISVTGATDYLAKLEAAHVVLDRARRRQIIADGLAVRASASGVTLKADEGLLDEVTGLVEYPVVLAGTIDAVFMDLPPEVLATAMRTHQKYFSCLNPDGTPAPRFLFVANNATADKGAAIAAGNERVLRARLSDARFFWDQDLKVPLADRVDALKGDVAISKQDYDQTKSNFEVAAASLEDAENQLSYCTIVAPTDGYIGNRTVNVGNRVTVGGALMAVVQDIWVVANYKETQLGKMKAGQQVQIVIDAIPKKKFRGHIDSFSPGTGATFALLPPDNATGNFTKIVQRIPVKILFEPDDIQDFRNRLMPGLSVETAVDLDAPLVQIDDSTPKLSR